MRKWEMGGAGCWKGEGRMLTPKHRGQYSDAVLNELESQNDGQVEGILGKVKMLKDVRPSPAESSLPGCQTQV